MRGVTNPYRVRLTALALLAALVPASCTTGAAHGAAATAVAPVAPVATVAPVAPVARRDSLPTRLSDSAFWQLVGDISEPGGFFRITDNFTSNETEIGRIFSLLRASDVSGGVYIGVGPEQNLTYIAAIRPAMAFVVDIRRQAVMQHLMYKAMVELARDRAEFIALLFAKPRPPGLDSTTGIQEMWDAFYRVATDSALGRRTIARVEAHLTETHGFTFTSEESAQLRSVLEAFQWYGPEITTRGAPGGRGGGNTGGFAAMTGYSLDSAGVPQSFLSSEEHYRSVKRLQELNLVVPVSGDFGGPKAIRAIGAWLKDHGATVTAFYVSNVEQYLFGDGKADAFYANVATLPVTERSVFIRPYTMRRFSGYGGGGSLTVVGPGAGSRALCPIEAFLSRVSAGQIRSNNDALACAP